MLEPASKQQKNEDKKMSVKRRVDA